MWILLVLSLVTVALVVREPRSLLAAMVLTLTSTWALVLLAGALFARASPDSAAWALAGVLTLGFVCLVVLGVLNVANGLTMIRKEGRRPANLLSLLLGMGVLLWAALLLLGWRLDVAREQDAAWVLFIVMLVVAFPLAYLGFVLVALLVYSGLYGTVVRRWGRAVDVVVVLGAGLRGERVTPLLAARLDRGREVLERSRAAGRDAVLITSGGQGSDEVVPEATAMAGYLVENGVDPALVLQESRSTSTEENVRFSADVAAENGRADARFAVVTNNYHAFRTALLMREAGVAGYATGAPTARYYWPSAFLREYVALLDEHRWVNGAVLAVLCIPAALLLLFGI